MAKVYRQAVEKSVSEEIENPHCSICGQAPVKRLFVDQIYWAVPAGRDQNILRVYIPMHKREPITLACAL